MMLRGAELEQPLSGSGKVFWREGREELQCMIIVWGVFTVQELGDMQENKWLRC